MSTFSELSFIALLGALIPTPVLADDWPFWRGPNRDGHSEEKGILKSWEGSPPKLLWMTEGLGSGYSSVSVSKGVIYTTGNFDGGQGVIAVRVKDGEVLWTEKITAADRKRVV